MRRLVLLAVATTLTAPIGCGRDASPRRGTPALVAVSGGCIARAGTEPPEPDEPEPDDRHARAQPEDGAEVCAASDATLAAAENAILVDASKPAAPAAPTRAWDHRTKPLRLDEVARRFALQPNELDALRRNGFVVPSRLEVMSYAGAFHEIYQSELPLYVTADSIFHAVSRSSDHLLMTLEARRLEPLLRRTLAILHCALPVASSAYSAEAARDLDVYLTVARSLLAGATATGGDPPYPPPQAIAAPVTPEAGPDVQRALASIKAGASSAQLFGRDRPVAFASFTPRGHYAGDDRLSGYFRATAWLSRVALDLGSPREAAVAAALADLVARSGTSEAVATLEAASTLFGGPRVDAPLQEVAKLGAGATSLLGARRPPLGQATSAAEIGGALGHDRAAYDRGAQAARIDEARRTMRALGREDLPSLWLRATFALATPGGGAVPSFTLEDAFADLRLDSALVAFAELRHTSVMFAGQPFERAGCEIPDAYVEPVPAVFGGLAAYAEKAAMVFARVDPDDLARARAYLAGLSRKLRLLQVLATGELSGRILSDVERRWLAMVVQMTPGSTSSPPSYDGWYLDLFPARTEALARADFVAEVARADGAVTYVGTRPPRFGVFVVDSSGPPRVVVGPVAHGYETVAPMDKPLDDEAAAKLGQVREPWSASYAVPLVAPPSLALQFDGEAATVTSASGLGDVTLELLDHHRRPLQALTKAVGPGETTFAFRPASDERPVEILHLHVGAFDSWIEAGSGPVAIELGPSDGR